MLNKFLNIMTGFILQIYNPGHIVLEHFSQCHNSPVWICVSPSPQCWVNQFWSSSKSLLSTLGGGEGKCSNKMCPRSSPRVVLRYISNPEVQIRPNFSIHKMSHLAKTGPHKTYPHKEIKRVTLWFPCSLFMFVDDTDKIVWQKLRNSEVSTLFINLKESFAKIFLLKRSPLNNQITNLKPKKAFQ